MAIPLHPPRGNRLGRAALGAGLGVLARAPLGPLVAAIAAARVADRSWRLEAAVLTFAAFFGAALVLRRSQRAASHLPVLRLGYPLLVATAGAVSSVVLSAALRVPPLSGVGLLIVLLAGTGGSMVADRTRQRALLPRRRIRIAFIGSGEAGGRLADDLSRPGIRPYHFAGRIAVDGVDDGPVRVLGGLDDLRDVVVRERIDLVVLGTAVARLAVFDAIAASCLDLPVQLIELSAFYEDVFGHVPTAEINAAWFVHLVDAHARRPSYVAKRAFDLALAVVIAIPTLPFVALVGALIRLDGGSAFFAQTRIGESGRPFRLYKLRTMRSIADAGARWAQERDPRTTRLGRFLRRSHLDELPQLWNIVRGDMSFIGPRPEQLEFVERLERTLPFYQRRHLIRPGLTGWAQVRCGYARSDMGAAWKLCNDLYYVKHRSIVLDLLLLAETIGLLVRETATGSGASEGPWAGTGLAPDSAIVGLPPVAPVAAAPAGDIPVVAMAGAREDGEEARVA